MKNVMLIVIAIIVNVTIIHAQIGIGTQSPDPNSALDITSSDKGVLLPRVDLNSVQIPNPPKSLIVWNTDAINGGLNEGFYFYNGNSWVPFTDSQEWMTAGNSNTDPNLNFIGTKDQQPLSFRTEMVERLSIGCHSSSTNFTNINATTNTSSSYSGSVTGVAHNLNLWQGSNANGVNGIENLLYLRAGSSNQGTFRAQRNRIWSINTNNYNDAEGIWNEFKLEGTDIQNFKGFRNSFDLRAGGDINELIGFSNDFPGQLNGTVTTYYGYKSDVHSSLSKFSNYYGFFQSNLGNTNARYAFYYEGNASTNDVVVSGKGNLGIGVNAPTHALHINAQDPIKIEGTTTLNEDAFILSSDSTGIVHKIPYSSLSNGGGIGNGGQFEDFITINVPSGNGVRIDNLDAGLDTNPNVTIIKLVGGTQQFTITGLKGGSHGRKIRLYHSGQNGNMILKNEGNQSLAENRFLSMSNGNQHTNGRGIITLVYDGDDQRWIILNIEQ